MASTERSTSASSVDQLLTEIRRAALPRQVVPLSAQAPDDPAGGRDSAAVLPANRLCPGGIGHRRARSLRAVLDAVVPAELAHAVQRRHPPRAALELLSARFAGGSARRHLFALHRHRPSLEVLGGNRARLPPRALARVAHREHQWPLEWHRAVAEDARCVGRRGQSGRQAEGGLLRLPRALARRRRGVPRAARQHRRRGQSYPQSQPRELSPTTWCSRSTGTSTPPKRACTCRGSSTKKPCTCSSISRCSTPTCPTPTTDTARSRPWRTSRPSAPRPTSCRFATSGPISSIVRISDSPRWEWRSDMGRRTRSRSSSCRTCRKSPTSSSDACRRTRWASAATSSSTGRSYDLTLPRGARSPSARTSARPPRPSRRRASESRPRRGG